MCATAYREIFCSAFRLGQILKTQFGAPYRVAHRADLLNGLLESARSKPGIELRNNAEVTNVSIAETTLSLKSGKSFKGEAIIAADGVHSAIRNLLAGQPGKNPIGHMLHRGLIPIASVPASVNIDVVTLWLFPGGHVVHYAVSNWRHFNIVAAVEDPKFLSGPHFRAPASRSPTFLIKKSNGRNGRPLILLPRGTGAGTAPCSSAMPPTPPALSRPGCRHGA